MTKRLDAALENLHHAVTFPVDDIEIRWEPPALRQDRPARRTWMGRAALAAAGLVVVTLLVAVPQVRRAVADLLSAAGIEVAFIEGRLPEAADELDLGEPITLSDVSSHVAFAVRVPESDPPGPVDGVFVDDLQMIHMVWLGDPELPVAGDAGVGLLFSQWAEAGVGFEGAKTLALSEVTGVLVEGTRGLWIEGATHTLTIVDLSGRERVETTRLAANVLLWSVDGVNYRLETTGNLRSALDIVETLQPVG